MITLLERASLVPLLTLKRPWLGSDVWPPDSGQLLPRTFAESLVVPANLMIYIRSIVLVAVDNSFQPFEPFPRPGQNSWPTSVLAGKRGPFPEGVHRFLLVAMHGLYLAGLLRL